MKPSLFIVSFITLFIGIASAAQVTIKDAKGRKVLNNVPYHLGPASAAKGGGFKLTDTANNKKICPYDVVQDPSAANLGDAFSFTHTYKRPKYLHTEGNLGIDSGFSKTGPCQKSTFWTIPDAEAAKAPDNLVTTGGGFDDGVTCFQLVEHPKPTDPKVPSYMLQHCPYYCGGPPPPICYNVSIYVDNGVRRLGSRGTPFEFVFHKVPK